LASIIIDTSSILFGFASKKDVFHIASVQLHGNLIISKGVIRELASKASNRGARGAHAKAALESLRHMSINIMSDQGNVDSWITRSAKRLNAVVVTNDTMLAKRLSSSNIMVFKLSKSGQMRRFRHAVKLKRLL
jgi:rRNA-processing protein FCF1